MKKILFVAALAIVSLASCSKDDSEPATTENPDTTVLLRKSIQTINNGEKITATYTYDGNRLLRTEYSNGYVDVYTYTYEKLTTLEVFRDDELYSTETFSYGSSFNVTGYTLTSPTNDKELYFKYVAGDQIKVYAPSQFSSEYVGLIQLNGDNVFQYTTMLDGIEYATDTYIWDGKNNPLKNFTANKILAIARQKGGANNINQYVRSGIGSQGKGYTTTYVYNSGNYPVSSEEINVNGDITKTEYFYE